MLANASESVRTWEVDIAVPRSVLQQAVNSIERADVRAGAMRAGSEESIGRWAGARRVKRDKCMVMSTAGHAASEAASAASQCVNLSANRAAGQERAPAVGDWQLARALAALQPFRARPSCMLLVVPNGLTLDFHICAFILDALS